jgi:hypothetical protein
MKIDEKVRNLGITEEVINILVQKTKHKKATIDEVKLNHVDKNGVVCLDLIISNSFRSFMTLHVSLEKNLRIKRDLSLRKILEE